MDWSTSKISAEQWTKTKTNGFTLSQMGTIKKILKKLINLANVTTTQDFMGGSNNTITTTNLISDKLHKLRVDTLPQVEDSLKAIISTRVSGSLYTRKKKSRTVNKKS
ncbi:hypothetical protein BB561_004295 [Smittium simulii]|uniref:Uncharacterized protein n=1 Tax=Smittium simulii TaxID=133385 RepID=A0A2T9YH32_9FUNG|nr:hypothetical protein BB561_004295 [Smittium simulii]